MLLFESVAAATRGDQWFLPAGTAMALVLSIKKMGGKVIAQDQPCVSFSMPNSAINTGSVVLFSP